MVRPPQFVERDFAGAIYFHNPNTTDTEEAGRLTPGMCHAAGVPEDVEIITIRDRPTPELFRTNMPAAGNVLVLSDGGDGSVQDTLAAQIGHVANDPDATDANLKTHRQLLQRTLYIAGHGGRARNLAHSMLGNSASRYPLAFEAFLATGRIGVTHLRPLLFSVTDENDKISQTGVAVTTLGLGLPCTIMQQLEASKTDLAELSPDERLRRERRIVWQEVQSAEPFAATIAAEGLISLHKSVKNMTGLTLIHSSRYAIDGRASRSVNVDTSRAQIVYSRRHTSRHLYALTSLGNLAALFTGLHPGPPFDFDGSTLRITIEGNKAVPIETDGNTNDHKPIEPGQTLRVQLAKLVVPTLTLR